MNLLALDIGNSNIKAGAFQDSHLIHVTRHVYEPNGSGCVEPAQEWQHALSNELSADFIPDALVYTSVVPSLEAPTVQPFLEKYGLNPTQILPVVPGEIQTPVNLRDYPADQLGPDRLVNAVAAHAMFPNQDVLVVDLGTATTFDVVDADGNFRGGAIAPGLETFWKTLTDRTARLPDVPLKRPPSILGKNTAECLQAGLSAGYIGLYNQIVMQTRAEVAGENLQIVLTGGLAHVFQEMAGKNLTMAAVTRIEPWLTLMGLCEIHQYILRRQTTGS